MKQELKKLNKELLNLLEQDYVFTVNDPAYVKSGRYKNIRGRIENTRRKIDDVKRGLVE
jgi:hypothetical protein